MKRPWFWLGTIPVAALAILVFASSFGTTAHEADDSADVEREAVAALGGGCSDVAYISYREVSPEGVDAEAKARGITGSGWVGSRFIGSPQELAASKSGSIAASGRSTAWILTEDDASGKKTIIEFRRLELPSGRVAWRPGKVIANAPCE